MDIEIEPIAVIQEGRAGINPAPDALTAQWGQQWIGVLFPAIVSAGLAPAAARLEVVLLPRDEGDYTISQTVAVCAPPDGNGVPSTWLVEEELLVEGAGRPGDVFWLPVPIHSVMGEAGWGVVLHSAGNDHDNLRATVDGVRLRVTYAVPDVPEPDPQEYAYTIHRAFVPGDRVVLNVVDDGRQVAEMRFII